MKRALNTALAIVCTVATLAGVQAQAQETASPLVRQIYDGNWPSAEEAQQLRDELYYQRAIHAYMTMLPALNVIGHCTGQKISY